MKFLGAVMPFIAATSILIASHWTRMRSFPEFTRNAAMRHPITFDNQTKHPTDFPNVI